MYSLLFSLRVKNYYFDDFTPLDPLRDMVNALNLYILTYAFTGQEGE